ncbi:MAG: ParB N-terminal domain-containing protein [Thermodesulfobacteriaceae bacterium]|nr:ParB N-terminal domain-containing protein [Thermodesulfobacteriaceae bacterium]
MNFFLQRVKIEKINLQDRIFCFSFPKRDSFLLESIQKFGLLQPPLLLTSEDSYKIVAGEGRILALKKLAYEEIPALILPPSTSPLLALLLSLESNLFRNLNLLEKAEFFKRAKLYFSIKELLKLLPKLGFTEAYHWLEFLENVNALEEKFKLLILEEKLNPQILALFNSLDKNSQEEFLKVLESLKLSFSEQREVLQKLVDYKKRKDLPNLVPLELKEALQEEDFNKRRGEFFKKLKELFFPTYVQSIKKIEPICQKFKQEGIEIIFSPYLEKRELEIRFKVKNLEDLEKRVNFLKKENLEPIFID